MHPNANPAHADGLVLESYGAGYAWLRAELDAAIRDAEQLDRDMTARLGWPEPDPQPEDVRYAITEAGRDYLARERAMQALVGPWVNVAGRRTWTDPHQQKPGNLCGRMWACGEPVHHHNCSDCQTHCRLGDTAQDHETADPSAGWTTAHCRCAYCAARRAEVA